MFLDVSMSVKKSLQFSMSTTLKTELSSQLLFRLRFQFVVIEVFLILNVSEHFLMTSKSFSDHPAAWTNTTFCSVYALKI